MQRICEIYGCENNVHTRGWCQKHYKRWKTHGTTELKTRKNLSERFEDSYIPVTESGCWIWIAATMWKGYGCIRIKEKTKRAHRVSYELYVGPIPD